MTDYPYIDDTTFRYRYSEFTTDSAVVVRIEDKENGDAWIESTVTVPIEY